MLFFLPSPVLAATPATAASPAAAMVWPFRRKPKPKFRQPAYWFPTRRSQYFLNPRKAD